MSAHEVSLEKAEAEVSYDPARTEPKEIADSVSRSGFGGSGKQPAEGRKASQLMSGCCQVETRTATGPARCTDCDQPGRKVDPITVKALVRPEALARLSAPAHWFCPTASCPLVYFGDGEAFDREEVAVPVFQKEPAGDRTVCYCFAISEADLRREIAETGRSAAAQRISAHVNAGRCACEIKNPQGSCCLGNVAAVVKALEALEGTMPPSGATAAHESASAASGCPGRTGAYGDGTSPVMVFVRGVVGEPPLMSGEA